MEQKPSKLPVAALILGLLALIAFRYYWYSISS